jgi:hypothetical protein
MTMVNLTATFPLSLGFGEGIASQTYCPATEPLHVLSMGNETFLGGGGVRYVPPTREFTLERIAEVQRLIEIYRRSGENRDYSHICDSVLHYARLIRDLPPNERFAHFLKIAELVEPGRLSKWSLWPKTRRENRASEESVQVSILRDASQLIPDLRRGDERLEALVVIDRFRSHRFERVRRGAEFAISRYLEEVGTPAFTPSYLDPSKPRPKRENWARLAYSHGQTLSPTDIHYAMRKAEREDLGIIPLHWLLKDLSDYVAALPPLAPALGALFVLSGRMERILPTKNIEVLTESILDKMASDRSLQGALLVLSVSGTSEKEVRNAAREITVHIPGESRVRDVDQDCGEDLLSTGDLSWKSAKTYGQVAIRLQPKSKPPLAPESLETILEKAWEINLKRNP